MLHDKYATESPLTAKVTEKQGQIPQELESLHYMTSELLEKVEILARKLSPVMGSRPEPVEKEQELRPYMVPVALQIRENRDRLAQVAKCLGFMIEDIQV